MKFALYDYLGRPKAHYRVDNIEIAPPVPVKQPSHHILVLDRSGSMYGDLPAVKTMVEKVLTLEEYRDANMLVSVLSYSSMGDLSVHVDRAPVSEVLVPNSRHVDAIRKIQVTGLTCISQALKTAMNLIRPHEMTCVSLHTDGYANDKSPGAEKREIEGLLKAYAAMPNVFVNTIAYRNWCDFGLLTTIANACSGTCFKTPTAKEVFDTLHQTSGLLSGAVTPAFEVPRSTGAYVTFVSRSGDKGLGSADTLLVRGVKAEDDKRGYRYTLLSATDYANLSTTVAEKDSEPVLAFAFGQLAEGNVNAAKYALMANRNLGLLQAHARALTNGQLSEMATEIRRIMFTSPSESQTYTDDAAPYELPNARQPSVIGILGLLSRYGYGDMEVDVQTLRKSYKRRGVRRIPGTRNVDGSVTPPKVRSVYRTKSDFVPVLSFNLNRNNATVNMTLSQPIDLIYTATGESVGHRVAEVDLSGLRAFNSYTVVGDGELNLPALPLRISNKRLHRELEALGLISGNYDPTVTHTIDFSTRPVVAYDATFDPKTIFPPNLFDNLAGAKILTSIIAACLKDTGASDTLSEDQVNALKDLHLTANLYFSPPTTTEYADLNAALADGSIDTRVSYKVDFGTTSVLNLGELHSANKFYERMYEVSNAGVVDKKPKLDARWNSAVTVGPKILSARTKVTPVDHLMKPYFDEFLGLSSNTHRLTALLKSAGLSDDAVQAFLTAKDAKTLNDNVVEAFSDTRKALDTYMESLYEGVSSLVFFVGSTGLIPEEFGASKGMDADALKQAYPTLEYCIGKDQADGTFYAISDTILSVYPKTEYFSTTAPTED
jgi:hypothetical protein